MEDMFEDFDVSEAEKEIFLTKNKENIYKHLNKQREKDISKIQKEIEEYSNLIINEIDNKIERNELDLIREQVEYNICIKSSKEIINTILDYIDETKIEIIKELKNK